MWKSAKPTGGCGRQEMMSATVSLSVGSGWRTAVSSDGEQGRIDPRTGFLHVETDDGGLLIKRDWREKQSGPSGHNDNLVLGMSQNAIGVLGDELLRGIAADDQSRQEYLETIATAIAMLGLKIEEASGDAGGSDAPVEGMSKIRHPMLLKACIRFQADFVAEMLPADGPVKVRSDAGEPPAGAAQGADATGLGAAALDNQPPEGGDLTTDDLARALESDLNHYLTQTASEYYPDTSRMAFRLGLTGCSFKKVYNCPLRKRPVSESVDASDIIVSYGATDLGNAPRVTHRIMTTQGEVRKLVRAKVYRDVNLGQPITAPDAVAIAEAEASGTDPYPQLPTDHPHTIYECYTDLDPQTVGDDGDDWRPYKVSIDKDSRQVLEVRRNWDPDDILNQSADQPKTKRRVFVKYPYVDAIGFYAIGLMHILGNTTQAMTAIWREMIDSGMFANFPGLIGSDDAGRQNTSDVRVPPGGVRWIKTGGKPINTVLMDLPYKPPDAAFMQFAEHVETMGDQLGGTASVPLNEGAQNAPVGTMLATIEQALKPVEGVFKGLHRAQSEEFQLLKERFREDPEALWRFNRRPAKQWERAEFLAALDNYNLVPMADPNTASQVQRIMKAAALFELAKAAPYLFKQRTVALRLMRMVGIPDPEEVLNSQEMIDAIQQGMAAGKGKQSNPDVDQSVVQKNTAQAGLFTTQARALEGESGQKANAIEGDLADKAEERKAKAASAVVESEDREADRQSREKVAEMREQTETLKARVEVGKALVGHGHEGGLAAAEHEHEARLEAAGQVHEAGMAERAAAEPQEKKDE